jgi:hypothetical protein
MTLVDADLDAIDRALWGRGIASAALRSFLPDR